MPFFSLLALSSCSGDDAVFNDSTAPIEVTDPDDTTDDPDDAIDPDDTIVIEDSTPSFAEPSQGFYVLNEDWFGHDNGSVNYFKNDGSIVYRAYRAANNGEKLGITPPFATIYGNNVYFVSKQANRLVVADAKTFKNKANIVNIGGDGRSFVGISSEKGYIATSNGVSIFNIKTMTVEGSIDGITRETGNMLLVGDYVLAITSSTGAYVINTKTDTHSLESYLPRILRILFAIYKAM